MLSENKGYLHKTMQMGCRDLSMRTGTYVCWLGFI